MPRSKAVKTVPEKTKEESLIPVIEDYRQLTEIEHVLYRPDMWMGDTKINDIPFFFMSDDFSLEKRVMSVSRSILHIFSEFITNASDNAALSRQAKYPIGQIGVTVGGTTVTVENNGVPIPVEKNKDGVWLPEMIFGKMRTGVNFGDIADQNGKVNDKTKVRKGAGKNGLGGKIGNIYSKSFSIECHDTHRKRAYTQSWANNMTIVNSPVITDFQGEVDYVKVSYDLEFSRFGYPEDFQYSQELIDALRFIACNNAISQCVPIFFNGKELPSTMQAFIPLWKKMKFPTAPEQILFKKEGVEGAAADVAKSVVEGVVEGENVVIEGGEGVKEGGEVGESVDDASVSPIPDTDDVKAEDVENVAVDDEGNDINDLESDNVLESAFDLSNINDSDLNPDLSESGAVFSDEAKLQELEQKDREAKLAQVKDLYHIEWPVGVDVSKRDLVLPELELYIMDKIEGYHGLTFFTTSGAINTEGGEHEKVLWNLLVTFFESKIKNVTKTYIREQLMKNISAVIIYRAANPVFSDQSKIKLLSPKPIIIFSENEKKLLAKWDIITYIQELINLQALMNAKNKDSKRAKMITLKRLEDAGYAGKKGKSQTSLCYVEGESALGYPNSMRDKMENGVNLIGTLYSKGKIINADTASTQKLLANEQYYELKRALGLEENVDYTKMDNLAKLRYGELLIMTDADLDGTHIKGLLLLLISKRFPSLLKTGFVKFWISPIIRGYWKKESVKFYTGYEFEEWKKNTPNYGQWTLKYLKGLATSNQAEVKQDLSEPKKIVIRHDEYSERYLDLAFNADYRDLRKKWIAEYVPKVMDLRNMTEMTISEFVAYELVTYSIYNVERMIPSFFDGLKSAQRKCIEGSFQKWGAQATSYAKHTCKIESLGTFCAETTKYHHGAMSLYGVLANMCQDYVGSNNVPYYIPDSSLGSRKFKGKDGGAPRYVYIMMNPMLRRAWLREEDDNILDYVFDENAKCEPNHFEPVVNLLLINGCESIGTGSSCTWPTHKVEDVCKAQLAFIDGKPMKQLVPHCNGFEGKTKIEDLTKKEKPIKTIELCYNKFTDTPLNASSEYKRVIYTGVVKGNRKRAEITEIPPSVSISEYDNYLKDLVDKKSMHSFDNLSTSNKPHFVLYGHASPVVDNLRLIEPLSLTNLVALDELGRTQRFNTVNEYLEKWCVHRLTRYEERRRRIIVVCKERIEQISHNIAFFDAYFAKKFTIENKEDDEIRATLENLGFEYELLSKTNLNQLSKTRYQTLLKKKDDAQEELKYYETTPAKEVWRKEINEFLKEYKTYLAHRVTMNEDL